MVFIFNEQGIQKAQDMLPTYETALVPSVASIFSLPYPEVLLSSLLLEATVEKSVDALWLPVKQRG